MRVTPLDVVGTLRESRCVHILIHESPDGDCIGGGYAMAALLQQMGKKAVVKCSDPIPKKFEFVIPKLSYVPEDSKSDLVITIDTPDLKMLGTYIKKYSDKIDLCIDHHISNKNYASYLCLNSLASSTCEILYEMMKIMELRNLITITEEIAICLYVGIATDTGCFRFSNVSPKTLRIVAELLERLDNEKIASINHHLFTEKKLSQMYLESILTRTVRIYKEYCCTMSVITQQMINENHLHEEDYAGLANFPMQFEGTKIGVFMKETEPNMFKVSMRSMSDINVSDICQKFGGGGHRKAAGCCICGTEADVCRRILEVIKELKSEIESTDKVDSSAT